MLLLHFCSCYNFVIDNDVAVATVVVAAAVVVIMFAVAATLAVPVVIGHVLAVLPMLLLQLLSFMRLPSC